MKYAVVYYSETGNTEMLAKQIYHLLDGQERILVNVAEQTEMPPADVYFAGFPIHQKNCSIKAVEALEQIETGKLMLFATCGLTPTENYRKKLEMALSVWISDDVDYMGMFLCQGKTTDIQKEKIYDITPAYRDKLEMMFHEGDNHPNREDLEKLAEYIKETFCDFF
jgi:flavodoxin